MRNVLFQNIMKYELFEEIICNFYILEIYNLNFIIIFLKFCIKKYI